MSSQSDCSDPSRPPRGPYVPCSSLKECTSGAWRPASSELPFQNRTFCFLSLSKNHLCCLVCESCPHHRISTDKKSGLLCRVKGGFYGALPATCAMSAFTDLLCTPTVGASSVVCALQNTLLCFLSHSESVFGDDWWLTRYCMSKYVTMKSKILTKVRKY